MSNNLIRRGPLPDTMFSAVWQMTYGSVLIVGAVAIVVMVAPSIIFMWFVVMMGWSALADGSGHLCEWWGER